MVELYQRPPAESVVVCHNDFGPEAGKKDPGNQDVYARGKENRPVGRAQMEIDCEHPGKGCLWSISTREGRSSDSLLDRENLGKLARFSPQVETWIDPQVERVYAIMDNVGMYKGTDALLFALAHPCWEFVFQPTRAAYLNVIEP